MKSICKIDFHSVILNNKNFSLEIKIKVRKILPNQIINER